MTTLSAHTPFSVGYRGSNPLPAIATPGRFVVSDEGVLHLGMSDGSHLLMSGGKSPALKVFATVSAALNTFTSGRFVGLTAYIIGEGNEYWFSGGTDDSNFVPKAPSYFRWNTM